MSVSHERPSCYTVRGPGSTVSGGKAFDAGEQGQGGAAVEGRAEGRGMKAQAQAEAKAQEKGARRGRPGKAGGARKACGFGGAAENAA